MFFSITRIIERVLLRRYERERLAFVPIKVPASFTLIWIKVVGISYDVVEDPTF